MIGIIGAMKVEVEALKKQMDNVEVETISSMDFYRGQLCGKEVVVAVSGVGKVSAAMCTQTMILRYSPTMIINTGVAGGISGGLKIGDIVIGSGVVQHDMDTSPLGDPVGLISSLDIVEMPCSPSVISKLEEAAAEVGDLTTKVGVVATGDQFVNKKEDLTRIVDQFGAMACEMEGGSIGQVCYTNGVDFGVIRSISDGGDEESNMDFMEFVNLAAKNSIALTKSFLQLV